MRWLTDQEQRAWRGLIQMTAQLQAALNRQLLDEHGISLADYEVLARLHEAPGRRLRARDLLATLAWEQSRLSHCLARMHRRGLVERHDCPGDGRGAAFALTDTGRSTIRSAAPGHVSAVRRLVFDDLGPDQVRQLSTATTRVLQRLAAEADGTAPDA